MSEELTARPYSRNAAPGSARRAWVVALVVVALHAWTLGSGAWLSALAPAWPTDAPQRPLQTRLLAAQPAVPAAVAARHTTPSPPSPNAGSEPLAATTPTAPPDAEAPPVDPVEAPAPPALESAASDSGSPGPSASASHSASAPPAPGTAQAPAPTFTFPPSVVLNYDVVGVTDGQKNVVSAAITWKHDGAQYQSSLVVTKFLLNLRQWTSKGLLGAEGVAPVRFAEKGWRRPEVAAHFVREEGRVVFSANTAPVALLPGAQDHLSVFMQLASLWAGAPLRWHEGDALAFQSIGPRQSETWTFVVSAPEPLQVPGGTLQAIKLTREATGEYSTKAELWLAPQLHYLPARIRLSESNGNVLDMVWTDSQAATGPG